MKTNLSLKTILPHTLGVTLLLYCALPSAAKGAIDKNELSRQEKNCNQIREKIIKYKKMGENAPNTLCKEANGKVSCINTYKTITQISQKMLSRLDPYCKNIKETMDVSGCDGQESCLQKAQTYIVGAIVETQKTISTFTEAENKLRPNIKVNATEARKVFDSSPHENMPAANKESINQLILSADKVGNSGVDRSPAIPSHERISKILTQAQTQNSGITESSLNTMNNQLTAASNADFMMRDISQEKKNLNTALSSLKNMQTQLNPRENDDPNNGAAAADGQPGGNPAPANAGPSDGGFLSSLTNPQTLATLASAGAMLYSATQANNSQSSAIQPDPVDSTPITAPQTSSLGSSSSTGTSTKFSNSDGPQVEMTKEDPTTASVGSPFGTADIGFDNETASDITQAGENTKMSSPNKASVSSSGGGASLSLSSEDGSTDSKSSTAASSAAKKANAEDDFLSSFGGGGGIKFAGGSSGGGEGDTSPVNELLNDMESKFDPSIAMNEFPHEGDLSDDGGKSLASENMNSANLDFSPETGISGPDSATLFKRIRVSINRCLRKGCVINGLGEKI